MMNEQSSYQQAACFAKRMHNYTHIHFSLCYYKPDTDKIDGSIGSFSYTGNSVGMSCRTRHTQLDGWTDTELSIPRFALALTEPMRNNYPDPPGITRGDLEEFMWFVLVWNMWN